MIDNITILNTNTDVVSVPALKNYAVTGVLFCNHNTASEVLQVYAVKNGGSIANGSKIAADLTINGKDTYMFEFKLLLEAGAKIVAIGSTGSIVTATPTWLEI